MFLAKENLAVVLLLATCVTLSLTLPTANDNLVRPVRSVANLNTPIDGAAVKPNERKGRILLPTDFAVKKKKYSIGIQGVGTFFNAWRNCIAEGKGLATIESEEEQTFLQNMLASISPRTQYWIGATNLGSTEFALTWITTDLPVDFAPFEIDVNATTCISMRSSGTWYNNDCFTPNSPKPYICEEYY